MEIKTSKNKMNNKKATFSNDGDVVNGDKCEITIFNTYIENNETYEILTRKENYSEFYKNYIVKFEELDDYAFSLFYPQLNRKKFEFTSKTLCFGKKVIDWIYGIDVFPKEEVQEFYTDLKIEFGFEDDTFIVKRWNANTPYFNGNLYIACEKYNELFDEMNNNKIIPLWYKDDINIDGRNILNEYENTINKFTLKNKFQERLSKNRHKLSYPDIDRIKSEIFESVSKHIFNNKNKSKYTTIYGVGLEECFTQIQNLIFLAIFYGSITHLKLVRKLISNVMYMYADTFEDEEFYILTMRMLLLSGELKKYKNLYDKIKLKYNFINSNDFIQNLFESRKSLFEFEQDKIDIFLYDVYGRYINDDLYKSFEEKMLDIIKIKDNYQMSLITDAFRAITANIKRFYSIEKLLNIMKEYFEKSYSRFYIEFDKVLSELNIEQLSEKEFECFQFIIDSLIVNNENRNYNLSNCIIAIKKRNVQITKYDYLIEKEGSNENIEYKIELQKNQFMAVKDIVKIYKKRHKEREDYPGLYSGYATDYTIGSKIFSEKIYKDEMKDFILNDYLLLAKDIILSPNENIYEKIRHIKLLAHLLMIEKDNNIVKDVINTIHKSKDIKYSDAYGIGSVNSRDEIDLNINIMMCDFINSNLALNELLANYLEISINNENNVEEILDCINILKNYIKKNNNNVMNKLFLLFNVCYKINDVDIRNDVVIMSKIFIGTEYQEKILIRLKERANNITFHEVRGYINLIRNTIKKEQKVYKDIIKILNNSPNFYIRYMCNKYL